MFYLEMITFISSDQAWPGWAWLEENKQRTGIKSARVKNGKEIAEKKLKIFGCCATTPGTEAQHSGQAGSFLPAAVELAVEPAVPSAAVCLQLRVQAGLCSRAPPLRLSFTSPFCFQLSLGLLCWFYNILHGSHISDQTETDWAASQLLPDGHCVSPLLSSIMSCRSSQILKHFQHIFLSINYSWDSL